MIIGENINSEYYGYEEENYDYLFRRKNKAVRLQKKAERKEKRAEKKQLRQDKRTEKKLQKQDSASGGKRRLPILGNFGLFDKNKNKINVGASGGATSSSAKKEQGVSSESFSSEESKPDTKSAAGTAGASASQDKTDSGTTSGSESAATGGANLEGGKKEAGMGAIFGFLALGVVVTVIGVVLFRVDKKSNPAPQPLKVAA